MLLSGLWPLHSAPAISSGVRAQRALTLILIKGVIRARRALIMACINRDVRAL